MRTGQARKRDANEGAIVEALEALGATVYRLSGQGVPDLLVYFRGTWTPLEVKNKAGKNRSTPEQVDWEGVPIVRTVDEALNALGLIR